MRESVVPEHDEEESRHFLGTSYKSGYYSPNSASHFANFFNTFMDTYILVLPFFMNLVGAVLGLAIYLSYSFIMMFNLDLLFRVAEKYDYKGRFLHRLAEKVLGPSSSSFVWLMVALGQMAVFVSTALFAIEFSQDLLCLETTLCYSYKTIVLVLFLLTVVIALIPNIKLFSFISLASTVIISAALLIIIVLAIQGPKAVTLSLSVPQDISFYKILLYFSVVSYTIEGVGLAFPLRASFLEKHTPYEFKKLYYVCSSFVTTIFSVFAVSNFLKFGKDAQPIIFLNYLQNPYVKTAALAYTLSVFFSNLINLFPIFNDCYSTELIYRLQSSKLGRYWTRYIVRVCVVTFCFGFCTIGVNFIESISLAGGCICVFTGLVMPQLISAKARENRNWYVTAMGVVSIAIWFLTSFVAINNFLDHRGYSLEQYFKLFTF